VLGHRGKTFFERWRLGSVSKQGMHYAHCTTTVVR
jgi:nucleotide-binding universal stress UspA family protein